jgi:hypothetical protein
MAKQGSAPEAKLAGIFVFVCLVLLLSAPLAAEVLLSHPALGERLEVLVENESAPANLTLISPNGTRHELALVDGQASYPMDRIGRWEVRMGERRWNVSVEGPVWLGEAAGADGGGGIFWNAGGLLGLGMGLLLLALAAVAAYYLVLRAPSAQAPMLERRRRDGLVSVRLRAGTRPLEHVVLEETGGEDTGSSAGRMRGSWAGGARRLKRARLAAGQSLEIKNEAEGGEGEARASFELDGKREELAVREGVSRLEMAEDEVKLAGVDEGEGRREEAVKEKKSSSHGAGRRRLKRAES